MLGLASKRIPRKSCTSTRADTGTHRHAQRRMRERHTPKRARTTRDEPVRRAHASRTCQSGQPILVPLMPTYAGVHASERAGDACTCAGVQVSAGRAGGRAGWVCRLASGRRVRVDVHASRGRSHNPRVCVHVAQTRRKQAWWHKTLHERIRPVLECTFALNGVHALSYIPRARRAYSGLYSPPTLMRLGHSKHKL